ncbi:MAG TPA: PilN domain-containing protein [Gemmatimonas sp.]|uniref:PilN domain-containing protein n=1 Tax=Gemmatimonas sp. TaxID=1962908 RepID=UPI002EDA6A73
MPAATLMLEQDRVVILPVTGATRTVSWEPHHPERVIEAVSAVLRADGGAPKSLTLLIGLAFLEAARPELPPVGDDVRQRMVAADHERFFVLVGPVAASVDGAWAFACEATLVQRWWDAFGTIAPVGAVMALPSAVRMAGLRGTWRVPTAAGEIGTIVVSAAGIGEVRRSRAAQETRADERAPLDVAACARVLGTRGAVTLANQLLDAELRSRLVRRDRSRRWRAGAMVAAALLFCVWAMSYRQARMITALETQRAQLEAQAGGPRAAQSRLMSALLEQRILDDASRASRTGSSPLTVLSALGRLVPPDAFVQRLEWNGERWRIDGSAADVSRLVPLLDADPAIVDVQSLAPSTRFMDGGRARSSFSLGFRVTPNTDATTPAATGATP